MTPTNSISLQKLSKSFGMHSVLNNLNLEIPGGSFIAILGVSGSGKTTMLRILAGFARPDSGCVKLGDAILDAGSSHVRPNRRNIGYVAQESNLFPHLAVGANVAFGLRRQERGGPKVAQMLDLMGLGGYANRYPHELSGGQQQRVALARALAVEPAVVLLDEPFAALDFQLRRQLRSEVKAILAAAGATVILVTQDHEEALSLGDMVAVVSEGQIVQATSPREIYEQPATPELAQFFGNTNILDGVVSGETITTAAGRVRLRGELGWPDGSVRVLIRPEQIELTPAGGASCATVESVEFVGSTTIVRVMVDTPAQPRVTLTARVLDSGFIAPGSTVTLHVRGAVHAWPACSRVNAQVSLAA